MAQLISTMQFDMTSFSFKRGVAYDSFSTDADGGTLTAADAPGLLAPFSYATGLSLWNGTGGIATATELATYMGTGLTANTAGTPNGGTVTGFLNEVGTAGLYLVGVSATAISVYNATQTTDRADDLTVLAKMLAGNDRVTLSAFADTFMAQEGDDTVNAGAGNDIISGNSGKDQLNGETGDDLLYGGFGYDILTGGYGRDVMYGGDGGDILRGNQDGDKLYGEAGSDRLFGGYGFDTLYGGLGQDTFEGETGTDVIYAGVDEDRDVFVFRALSDSSAAADRDIIHNFVSTIDDLDLSAMDANTSVAGNQTFVFNGTSAGANSVWYATTGASGIVAADVNGDSVADFSIRVTQISQLLASDFIL